MKIALLFDLPQNTGIGRYAIDLYELLLPYFEDVKLIYAGARYDSHSYYLTTNYLKRTNRRLTNPSTIKQNYKRIIQDPSLSDYVFHYLGSDYSALRYRKGVITVHDLIVDRIMIRKGIRIRDLMVSLERNRKLNELKRLHKKATKIITISNRTSEDLYSQLGAKSIVIQHWIKERFQDEKTKDGIIRNLSLDPKVSYILSVGNNRPNKRIDLLKEFAESLPGNFKLIKIGEPINAINVLNIGNSVTFEAYMSYFKIATAYIHLSDDEGFGRPVIEAISTTTPVICRDNDINRELLGNSGIYISESDIIGRTINAVSLLSDELALNKLRRSIAERIEMFSSKLAAEKYLSAYGKYDEIKQQKDSMSASD